MGTVWGRGEGTGWSPGLASCYMDSYPETCAGDGKAAALEEGVKLGPHRCCRCRQLSRGSCPSTHTHPPLPVTQGETAELGPDLGQLAGGGTLLVMEILL
jgi:hypothetical protein